MENDESPKDLEQKEPEKDHSKKIQTQNISVPSNKTLQIIKGSVKHSRVDGNVVYYDVRLKTARDMWIVRKRYTNFEELHNKLISQGAHKLPLLPPKYYKMFTDHLNENFIERRRALLDSYVKKLIANKEASVSQEVVNFFHDDQLHKQKRPSVVDDEDKVPQQNMSNNNGDAVTNKIPPHYEGFSDEEYEYPAEQEMTSVQIPSWRRMSDHVLYQIKIGKNHHCEDEESNNPKTWVVLKRFGQFWDLDQKLQSDFSSDPSILQSLPQLPPRRMKIVFDHMDEDFIEERRVLLENYLRRLTQLPQVAKNEHFLSFFGITMQ